MLSKKASAARSCAASTEVQMTRAATTLVVRVAAGTGLALRGPCWCLRRVPWAARAPPRNARARHVHLAHSPEAPSARSERDLNLILKIAPPHRTRAFSAHWPRRRRRRPIVTAARGRNAPGPPAPRRSPRPAGNDGHRMRAGPAGASQRRATRAPHRDRGTVTAS